MTTSTEDNTLTELVAKAQGGCQESLGLLCERFSDEINRYVYRMTLDQNLTDDIRQETLLQMCSSLKELRNAKTIKPWLLKIAWRKVINHYRQMKKHRYMPIHENNLVDAFENEQLEGLKKLISREIAETLVETISKLDAKLRSVLVLRCYENLSYREISSIMNCTETSVRVMFFRAKTKLKNRLGQKGVTAPMLLALLGLFGRITCPAQAIVISTSTMKVGGIGAVIGWVVTKLWVLILSLVLGAGIAAGIVIMNLDAVGTTVEQIDMEPKSFHFTKHAWKDAYIPTANLRMGRSLSKGAYEQWYFFPEGIEGPLFKMVQRWDPGVTNKLCSWLLNETGQYYYHSGSKTIYQINSPLAKRNTHRFPSDDQAFCDFLETIEGAREGVEYIRNPKTGLLIEIVDRRFANAKDFVSGVERNILNEKTFGDFRYKWPTDAIRVDERDAIHKQGWTLYEISGQVNGQTIWGRCRIPFVYGVREDYPPLLKLDVGDAYSILDSPDGAYVVDVNHKALAVYPSGSFFKGLVRPWFGLHTIDLLRRESVQRRIPFRLENLEYDGYSYQRRILTLYDAAGYEGIEVVFHVNVEKNQIDHIDFFGKEHLSLGQLTFSFPDKPDDVGSAIEMPRVKRTWFPTRKKAPGILWLFELAQGTLADE